VRSSLYPDGVAMALQKLESRTRLAATAGLWIPAFLQFFPLFYVISLSFKEKSEVFRYPPRLMPDHFRLDNFRTAFEAAPLLRFLLNSIWISTCITLLQILTAILAAYALSRMRFKGRDFVLALILATMMIPGEVTIIPNFLTVASFHWINTYRALILPFSASGFGIFLLYQFMNEIPRELEEAAFLDGCGRLRFLFQFMVPLSMPALVAFAVYAFVNAWNQYLWPLIVTQSTDMQTVQIGIGMFRSQNESVSWGVIMAATLILISPTLLLFIGTQKQFVRGMTMGGLK
jgi:sn-glycerol 3-phosphate transport system permease protein